MYCSKAQFKAFVKANGERFPFNDIKRTRTSFITRWILVRSHGASEVRYRPSNVFGVRTSCFTNAHLQSTIVSGNGIPVPPDFCDVLDCMEFWGRAVCARWEQDVISMFWDYLRPRGLDITIGRGDLFYDCIMLLMERKLNNYVFYHIEKVQILQQWQAFYGQRFVTTKNYFELATESIWFVEDLINTWIQIQTPMINVVPDEVES
jgi:hypothetical protein